jgi:hypothetical protein
MPQERVGQVRGRSDSLDAAVGLGEHLTMGRAGEVGELDGLRLDHSPSTGLRSGAYAGSRSTTSQDRWVRSQASIARLRPMVLALLVVVVHRHEGHLHPCLPGVQENRERWTCFTKA